MASPKHNLLPDGRKIWLIQAADDAGWHWDELLNEKPTRRPSEGKGWGGDKWIRSTPSRKRIRVEFQAGAIAFCYQAAPDKQIVGLARIASKGYENGKFDFDWWCRMPPVSLDRIKNDPLLRESEKAKVGQGTVFRLSPSEAVRLLELAQPNQELLRSIRKHLKFPLEMPSTSAGGQQRASEEPDEEMAAELIETAQNTARGFQNDLEVRKAVEQHAVLRARRHYEKKGYKVREQGRPFDLECTRKAGRLYVEVKGTQTAGLVIVLTPNEVEWAHGHQMELFVVHSIVISKVQGRVKVSGGVERVVIPWRPQCDALKAIDWAS